MNDLFNGKEIELPKYNFQTGRSEKSGKKLKMHENDVLVVEGIHALNPELTAQIPDEQIFRVYASALTPYCSTATTMCPPPTTVCYDASSATTNTAA